MFTSDPDHTDLYKQYRKVVKETITEKKNEMLENKCKDIERYLGGKRVPPTWTAITKA